MATPNNDYFYSMDGFFLFMLIAVLVLIYQVFMVDRSEITKLKKVYRLEGMDGTPVWQNNFRSELSDSRGQAGTFGLDLRGYKSPNVSGFLGGGGSEPPISFYPSEAGPLLFGKDYEGYPPKPAAMAEGMFSPVNEGMWLGADKPESFYTGR